MTDRIMLTAAEVGALSWRDYVINERAVTSPPMITPGRGSDHPALERLP
jgi:hypothetical protein